ncbi:MAG TPA: hypothetical protein VGE97_08405 [Nitrososphaera sp.]
MEAIKLNTRLGNCNLNIKAQLRNDKLKLAGEYCLQFMVWHLLGSDAYNKKSDFKRDAMFSDALAKHLADRGKTVLSDCFSDIEIQTSKYDKPDPIAKLIKEFISLGMSEADAKAMADQVQAKTAKPSDNNQPKPEDAVAV